MNHFTFIKVVIFCFYFSFSLSAQTLVQPLYTPDGSVDASAVRGDTLILGGAFSQYGISTGGMALLTSSSDVPIANFPKIRGFLTSSAPDGKGGWYVSGFFLKDSETDRYFKDRIEHILPNNTFDPSFSLIETGMATKMIVSGNKLYVSGTFKTFQGRSVGPLFAIDLSTTKLLEWNPNITGGSQFSNAIDKIFINGNTMYISGSFSEVGGQKRQNLAAIELSTGKVKAWSPKFDTVPVKLNDFCSYGDKLLIGGFFTINGQPPAPCVLVDTTSGQSLKYLLTKSWADTFYEAASLDISSDTLFVAGGGSNGVRVAAYNLKTDAFIWRKYIDKGFINSNTIQYFGGVLYISGGNFSTYNDIDVNNKLVKIADIGNAIAINATTGNLINWQPHPANGNYINSQIVATLSISNGKILIGGTFSTLNSTNRNGLIILDTKKGKLLSWQGSNSQVTAMKLIDTTLYVAGNEIGVNNRATINAYGLRSGRLLNWSPGNINGNIFAIEADEDRLYIGGNFTQVASQPKKYLASLDRKSGSLLNWAPEPNSYVATLGLKNGNLFVGGSFQQISGQARPYLGSFDLKNLLLTSWAPNPDGTVQAIVVTNNAVYAGGRFYKIGNDRRRGFAVIETNTGKVTPIDPFGNQAGEVRTIQIKGRYAFLGGLFNFGEKNQCNNLMVVDLLSGVTSPQKNICINTNSGINTLNFVGNNLYFGGTFNQTQQKNSPYLGTIHLPNNYFEPSLDSYFPRVGTNGGDVTINFYGDLIEPGMKVKLVALGLPDIIVVDSMITYPQDSRMKVRLNLRRKAVGEYDIIVNAPSGREVKIVKGFTIQAARPPELWSEIIGPDRVRVGRPQTFVVSFGNKSNSDAHGVILWLAIPKNAKAEFNFEVVDNQLKKADSVMYVQVDSIVGLPYKGRVYGLLIPSIYAGSVGSLSIKVTALNGENIEVISWIGKRPLYASPLNCDITECAFKAFFTAADLLVGIKTAPLIIKSLGCMTDIVVQQTEPIVSGDIDEVKNSLGGALLFVGDALLGFSKSAYGCWDKFLDAKDIAKLLPITRVWRIALNYNLLLKDLYDVYEACSKIDCEPNLEPEKEELKKEFDPVNSDPGDWRDWILPPSDPGKRKSKVSLGVNSYDPNDKIGLGVNAAHFVTDSEPLQYAIRFENQSTIATASAQVVRIVDTLDRTKFNLSTFQLGYFQFGNRYINVPPGLQNRVEEVDLRPKLNLILRIEAKLDDSTGILEVLFTSLDPITRQLTDDPLLGFLPPNKIAPEGEGSVFYTVRVKPDLPNRTVILNRAFIYFDTNPAIPTPFWTNTLDKLAPDSRVDALPEVITDTTFIVKWQGKDGESGIRSYNVYSSINNKPYQVLISNTTRNNYAFTGKVDSTYRFYVVAVDSVRNVEATPSIYDTQTKVGRVILTTEPILSDLVKVYPNPTNGLMTIELPIGIKIERTILVDVTGRSQSVSFQRISNGKYEVRLKQLPQAAYLLQIETNRGTASKRIEYR